jgi:hypothetical protein
MGVPFSSNLTIDSQRLVLQERPSKTDILAAHKNRKLPVALRRALSPSYLIRFVALLNGGANSGRGYPGGHPLIFRFFNPTMQWETPILVTLVNPGPCAVFAQDIYF